MKALTIWQPWASLIMCGAKVYEFRCWPAPASIVGQRVAIHAGARPVKRTEIAEMILRLKKPDEYATVLDVETALQVLEIALTSPGRLPRACVLGSAIIGAPVLSDTLWAANGGRPNDSNRPEHSEWAWPLTGVERYEPVRPARGAQGFWTWRDA